MKIEGLRSLNRETDTIINTSAKVKNAKKEKGDDISPKEKKELTDEEKEYKSLRKQIQEKLIKFATRVPIFMYLTDYREQTLIDVITQLEPGLFKKVTGLDVKDFELLCSLNVFNADLMNDAIYKFKRYEDSSLSYTGINRHEGEKIGLFNTVLDYEEMFIEQQASTEAPPVDESDIPEMPFVFEPDEEEEEEAPAPKKEKKGKKSKNSEVKIIQAAQPPKSAPAPIPAPAAAPVEPEKPKPIITPKPAFDESSVSVGTKVFHKAFGHGVVKTLSNNRMTVAFDDVEKPFVYPAAFLQGFLKIEE
jgi:hypothetical protein